MNDAANQQTPAGWYFALGLFVVCALMGLAFILLGVYEINKFKEFHVDPTDWNKILKIYLIPMRMMTSKDFKCKNFDYMQVCEFFEKSVNKYINQETSSKCSKQNITDDELKQRIKSNEEIKYFNEFKSHKDFDVMKVACDNLNIFIQKMYILFGGNLFCMSLLFFWALWVGNIDESNENVSDFIVIARAMIIGVVLCLMFCIVFNSHYLDGKVHEKVDSKKPSDDGSKHIKFTIIDNFASEVSLGYLWINVFLLILFIVLIIIDLIYILLFKDNNVNSEVDKLNGE